MTITQLPLIPEKADDNAQPEADDLRLWGVTSLIGCLDKPALLYWSAEQTAEAAVRESATWQAMLYDRGHDETVKWLRDARFRAAKDRLSATGLGTLIHDCCEFYALNGARPEPDWIGQKVREVMPKVTADGVADSVNEVAPFLDQFDGWLQAFQPEYIAAEVAVYHPEYGYAGTCDGFMRLDGVPVVFDYKSSRKSFDAQGKPTSPYPEVALQLAAYRHASLAAVWRPRRFERYRRRYYLLSPDEQALAVPVPQVEGGIAIHISPEHCEAYPIRCDETVFEAFLFVVEAARWQFELSKTVIGQPMTPPAKRGAVA